MQGGDLGNAYLSVPVVSNDTKCGIVLRNRAGAMKRIFRRPEGTPYSCLNAVFTDDNRLEGDFIDQNL